MPPPPTEEARQRDCLRDLLPSELKKNTFPSWKLLFDLVCYLVVRLMNRPAEAIAPNLRSTRHFTKPMGLIDLVHSSSAPLLAPRHLLPPPVPVAPPRPSPPPCDLLLGRLLVEIFSVHVDFAFHGTIHLIDGVCRSNGIYVRPDFDPDPDFYSRFKEWLRGDADTPEFKDELVLSGPHDAMTALLGFAIEVRIPEMDDYCKWLSDDSIIPDHLNTTTVTTCMGSLYFTYTLVSNAVRANVKFMMRLPWEASRVHGHIMAYIGTFEIGSTLFSKDDMNAACIDPHVDSGVEFCLPMDRACLAVPIGSSLHLKGELVFNGSHKVSINHSIRTEGLNHQSPGRVQDGYCHTVHVWFREVWM